MAVDVESFRQAGWERTSYLCMAALLAYEYCELSFCVDRISIILIFAVVLQFGNEVSITNTTLHVLDLTLSCSPPRSNIFGLELSNRETYAAN
jgi:hypothetical protein